MTSKISCDIVFTEAKLLELNKIRKEKVVTVNSYGAVIKKGIGIDTAVNKRRVIEAYTVIRVVKFNFLTKKVVVLCEKGIDRFTAEVDLDFLFTHCSLETPDLNQEVSAIYAQHVAHNLLDKDTAIFIIVMLLTYLCGLLLGKII